jgi:sRNA-binding carbon storage regulator CsrA
MLVLSRKQNEVIVVRNGDKVLRITVEEIIGSRDGRVRLGFVGLMDWEVDRLEVYEAKQGKK